MAELVRLAFFITVGCILILANLWFVKTIRNIYTGKGMSKRIAPFHIVNRESKEEKQDVAMVHMLQARLGSISRKLAAYAAPLEPARKIGSESLISSPKLIMHQLPIPKRVFEPVDIDLSIAGVKVGGILSWAHRILFEGRVLKVVVEYMGNRAIVVGNFEIIGGPPLYIETEPHTDRIVSDIAFTLFQWKMNQRIPEIGVLTLEEFQDLIATLESVAELNRKVALGRSPGEDYDDLLSRIEVLVERIPRWRALIRLAAETAEHARNIEKAVRYSEREKALTPEGDPALTALSEKIEELKRRLAASFPPIARDGGEDPAQPLSEQILNSAQVADLFKFIGIREPDRKIRPKIAVLGGLPPENSLPAEQFTVIGGETRAGAQELGWIRSYVDSLVQAILLITPNAHFLFAPIEVQEGGYYLETDLSISMEMLLSGRPDVLLITLGPMHGPRFQHLFNEAIGQKTLVVSGLFPPRAEQNIPFSYDGMQDRVMIVSGVDRTGFPMESAMGGAVDQRRTWGPHLDGTLFWAPGEGIPILHRDKMRVESDSGIHLAAALTAAVAANLRTKFPELELSELLHILHATSQKPIAEEGPPLVNLSAALLGAAELDAGMSGKIISESVAVNLMVPDNDPAGLRSTLQVNEHGNILSIKVKVNITHTYIGDLRITLVSPRGEEVVLHDRQGGSKDNIVNQYTADSIPALAELHEKEAHGKWSLVVSDLSHLDVGRLESWGLKIIISE